MTRYKNPAVKTRLAKAHSHTKWAPIWLIAKIFGKSKRVHPSRITHVKRSWKRGSIKP